jgi:hypothetical protein
MGEILGGQSQYQANEHTPKKEPKISFKGPRII